MVVLCNKPYPSPSEYDAYFTFPFPLSDFQKYAIEAIVLEQHVLITAHTGSGKTLPAEFAIEHLFQKKRKVIYTSPIKALSNQKFYDFSRKFPHIQFGLFTGDIKTNPEADVLIMTTEILMNALFQQKTGKPLEFQLDFSELGAVVFDEIHYINDEERGQVWEKSILMLPAHVQLIMLSATIDNPMRFAAWCEREKKVYLSSTNERVVPLTHYTFVAASESTLKTVRDKVLQQHLRSQCNKPICLQDQKGVFRDRDYHKMIATLSTLHAYKLVSKRKFVINEVSRYLRDFNMLPAIAFVFSRKQVEQCAREITVPLLEDDSKIPYIVQRECDQILRHLSNHEEYRNLPEYIELISLLEKGIGIHHSGMIPILREMVELLVSKKYIKLLFATESFAVGLDCPIKTAVFLSMTKFDGNFDRFLWPHEYTQMAGRAGRRGIDVIGNVVHCNNLFLSPTETQYREILSGKPPKLVSKYKISYAMILNVIAASDRVTIKTLTDFTGKSMMQEELTTALHAQRELLNNYKEIEFVARTPALACERFQQLTWDSKQLVNKKRKDCLREIESLKEQHRSIVADVEKWAAHQQRQKEHEKDADYLVHLGGYVATKTESVLTVLQTRGFVESNEYITLSPTGLIAAQLAEIDALIWTSCLLKWNYLEDFNVKQIVGLFSCATDVKVIERKHLPQTDDAFLKLRIGEIIDVYKEFEKEEAQRGIDSGIDYVHPLVYDIIDASMVWCDCASEEECKKFISTLDVSLGDFTKAMMKIATIARELSRLEHICKAQVDFFYKLSRIEDMVLKFIATNQSLYV